jgi:folylpolyglutamate synthase/dihydropteroate synthase
MTTPPTLPLTLDDWLIYIEQVHPQSIAMGLERVRTMKEALALAPTFPLIIVGGTNGKGSACMMLEAILHHAGYKVGCYTSPHLLRYNERVRIAREQVSDTQLVQAFEWLSARVSPRTCRSRTLNSAPWRRCACLSRHASMSRYSKSASAGGSTRSTCLSRIARW